METNWDKMFEVFNSPSNDNIKNICDNCLEPMQVKANELVCLLCGLVEPIMQESDDTTNKSSGMISINNGKYTRKFHASTHNNNITRYEYTKRMLNVLQSRSKIIKIPDNVLDNVAVKFTNIKIINESGEEHQLIKRGILKRQILAVMIYYFAAAEGIQYKKSVIATWAELPTDGFARAESFLRDINELYKLGIPFDNENTNNFISRYFKSIGIIDTNYIKFAQELVDFTENKKILMSLKLSSKAAGALWVVITHCKMKYSIDEVERCTDNTRSSTFNKFSTTIKKHQRTHFSEIFIKYNIPFIE